MTEISIPCVILRVNKGWYPGIDDDTLYEVTRGWWKAGPQRERADYALAVAGGVVRAVYRIQDWRPRYFDDNATGQGPTRWGFDGAPAHDQQHLIGADVSHLFPRGAANPIRYLNLDDAPIGRAEESREELSPAVESRTRSLRQICHQLYSNPVLHLSLGSKELFHSNFLGWLFERNADLASDVLQAWTTPDSSRGEHRVRRESHNLDLVVEIPGKAAVVIENKVFSLPDEAQLDRYAAVNIPAMGFGVATKVLLSLSDPGWPDGTYEGWTWVSYTDLSMRVAAAVRAHLGHDSFTVELVDHWIEMLDDLQGIAEQTRPDDDGESWLLDGDAVELLSTVGLSDSFQKFRTRVLMHRLTERFRARGLGHDHIESSFSNGTPLLGVRIRLTDGSQVGWQLQGNQWRRTLVVPPLHHGKGAAKQQQRVDYAHSSHRGWFDFTAEQALGPFGSAPSDAYKHYAPDFIYDYVKAPGLTVGQVLALGEVSLRAAVDYKSKFDSNV